MCGKESQRCNLCKGDTPNEKDERHRWLIETLLHGSAILLVEISGNRRRERLRDLKGSRRDPTDDVCHRSPSWALGVLYKTNRKRCITGIYIGDILWLCLVHFG